MSKFLTRLWIVVATVIVMAVTLGFIIFLHLAKLVLKGFMLFRGNKHHSNEIIVEAEVH